MQVECMPLDQWNTDSDIVDKTTWIAQARAAFQEELDGVMACYMEDGEEEDGGDEVDSDMD